MGTYLSKPNTEKETQTGSSTKIKYASTSMQGWRVYQEDAHNCILDLADGWSLFSVYDGHGGPEVAQYTAEKLPDFLKEDLFKGDQPIEQAFQTVFIEYDDHLRSAEAMKKLKQIAGLTKENQPNETEEEVAKMFEEASIPVKQIFEKYGVRLLRRNAGGVAQCLEDGVEAEDLEDEEDIEDEEKEDEEKEDEEKEDETEHTNGEDTEPIKNKKRALSDDDENESKRRKIETTENEEEKEETEKNEQNDDNEKSNEEAKDQEGGSNKACDTKEEDEESSDSTYQTEDEYDESEEELDDGEEPEMVEAAAMGGEVPGEDSGTTACVCLLSDEKIIVANIGDSRAVLCRDGKAIDLSVDHKPEDETETKRIEKAGGKVTEDGRVNGGLNLSRAFGDHFYKKNTDLSLSDQMISALPDVITKDLLPEDRFVIVACDGIWNSMESQQVVDFVKERLENKRFLADIVEELCDSCMADNTAGDGTGCDNMTVILIDLQKTSSQQGISAE